LQIVAPNPSGASLRYRGCRWMPFAYIGTGEETAFINHLDPLPRIREV
jgi:hypothetical protein